MNEPTNVPFRTANFRKIRCHTVGL